MTATAAAPAAILEPGEQRAPAARSTREAVLSVHAWTPALLSVRVARNPAFRFMPGHYARVGLADAAGGTVVRPLSIASAPDAAHLEFLCTLVPEGAFSSRLERLRVGDGVDVETPSFGFLTLDTLAPGTDLWLLASGTGLAPFLSMLRDARAWRAFDRIVLVHSVRRAAELACEAELRGLALQGPGTPARAVLRYLPVVTREPGATALAERIPALLAGGRLEEAAGAALDPAASRVMTCGNPDLIRDLRAMLGERGLRTTRRGVRGQMAFEKYW